MHLVSCPGKELPKPGPPDLILIILRCLGAAFIIGILTKAGGWW